MKWDIERSIRTSKEWWRAHNTRLPHEKKPKMMIRSMGHHCVKWSNGFPVRGGLENISPRKTMTGHDARFGQDCESEVGQCAQVHEHPDPTNGPEDHRSVGGNNTAGGTKTCHWWDDFFLGIPMLAFAEHWKSHERFQKKMPILSPVESEFPLGTAKSSQRLNTGKRK